MSRTHKPTPTFLSYRRVFPGDLNPRNTLFGGRLLAWIDEEAAYFLEAELGVASLAARSIQVEFLSPARQGDLLRFEFVLTDVGRTSMTMSVEVLIHSTSVVIASAEKFVAVHIDGDGVPAPHGYVLR